MGVEDALLYLAAVLAAAFLVSGVVPTWLATKRRRKRVAAFADRYRRWVTGEDDSAREWLIARRQEMQVDAMSVGRGVSVIAPPPAIGGHAVQHQMFLDLTSEQSFADMLISEQTRLDELATISHAPESREATQRRRLFNPFAWLRLAFERVVGIPRYVLRAAGFSKGVTDASITRAISVLWGIAVGAATIGGFAIALAGN